ncbi:MAG: hypothetical protein AB1716_17840 [Planctomycetota bacterium]
MLATMLMCNALFFFESPAQQATDGPKVTVLEIFDVRHARLKEQAESAGPRFMSDRPGLRLVLEIQGEAVARASHYGMLEVAAATTDKGGKLKLNDEALGFHDPREEFVEIDRQQMFFGDDDAPKDLIRIELPFVPPPRAAATLSVRGKVQLKQVTTVDVTVPAKPGAVKDAQLEKLGVKIKIVKSDDENGFAYEVSGKLDALHSAQVLDAQGEPLETSGSSSMSDGETAHREIMLQKALPDDAKLKLALVVKAENVPVSFDLKDLKLP